VPIEGVDTKQIRTTLKELAAKTEELLRLL